MFCAICTAEAPELVRRPLGKDDALVSICLDCDVEPARVVDGPDRPYEPQEGISMAEMTAKISAFSAAVRPNYRPSLNPTNVRTRTIGWLIVRVKQADSHGHMRDLPDCLKAFESKPWRDDVRYLGISGGWFLFERPDPKVLASLRTPSENPLASLEAYRVTA